MGFMLKAVMGFIMPGIITAIMGAVQGFGVTGKMDIGTAITMILTGLATYIVPNLKKA
jgi:hypothetical protein